MLIVSRGSCCSFSPPAVEYALVVNYQFWQPTFPRCHKPAWESRLSKLACLCQCAFRRRRRTRPTKQASRDKNVLCFFTAVWYVTLPFFLAFWGQFWFFLFDAKTLSTFPCWKVESYNLKMKSYSHPFIINHAFLWSRDFHPRARLAAWSTHHFVVVVVS